ncbi:MAG TPA: NUDIX hydrolase [Streptosporangiaceae bacterium]|jgi:ADP-ribose pyrophosphatase YjhB (NUDIX family)|nr:NUDIX hydrolase [Streptosporangiaceae bacterium]
MTEQPGFLDHATWFAQLPRVVVAAGALITDPAGQVLVVKPNYRPGWSLPGGVCEHGEPPHLGCAREVEEEVGLVITPGPLLVVHWLPPEDAQADPNLAFVFDGGTVDGPAGIRLQLEELDDFAFIDPGQSADYLRPRTAGRIQAALASRAGEGPVYLHG